jgi:hypothetical protein
VGRDDSCPDGSRAALLGLKRKYLKSRKAGIETSEMKKSGASIRNKGSIGEVKDVAEYQCVFGMAVEAMSGLSSTTKTLGAVSEGV